MNKNILFLLLLLFVSGKVWSGNPIPPQDQSRSYQLLYNGSEWRNFYLNVKGDQFLFSKDYLPANLTVNGRAYKNINIIYDIYNDQIITPARNGLILQLNQEMIDSFSFVYQSKTYHFINLNSDSIKDVKGYVNSLYSGKTQLVVKYKKEIEFLAVDDKYDRFYETYRVYILRDGIAYAITSKSDVLKALNNSKDQIKAFMKKNSIKVSKKAPDSFVPVLRYYDSLSQ